MGVIEEKGGQGSMTPDDKVFVPITAAQRQFNQDNVSLIFAQVNSSEEVSSAIPLVEETLKRRLSQKDFTVIDQKEILSTVSGIMNTLTVALGGIAAISPFGRRYRHYEYNACFRDRKNPRDRFKESFRSNSGSNLDPISN